MNNLLVCVINKFQIWARAKNSTVLQELERRRKAVDVKTKKGAIRFQI